MFPLLLVSILVALCTDACPAPQVPKNGKFVLRMPTNALPTQTSSYRTGTAVVYTCDAGFDLMGPQHRHCHDDGLWHPRSLPFCLSDVTGGLPAAQSSASNAAGKASSAVDGNRSTCASTKAENSPWLAVDLEDVFPITVVKLNFHDATTPSFVHATVRVGNSTRAYAHNAVCSVFKGTHAGQSVYLPCPAAVHGRHVSIHLHGTASLSVCEFVAYSEVKRPERSVTTVALQSFDYIRPYDVLVRNNLIGVYIAVSTIIFVVFLISVSVYCKIKCSAKSYVLAEFPVVGHGTSDPGRNESRGPVEKLI